MSDILTEADLAVLQPFQARLNALKSRMNRVAHWAPNKRYVIELALSNEDIPEVASTSWPTNTDFASAENQVLIDRGVIFQCEEIEVVYSVAGTSVSTGEAATFTIAAPFRSAFVDFYLKLRDTGSDREWQNDWVPGNFFASANLGGLILGDEAHALVSGGAAVYASLQVARAPDSALVTTGLENITQHRFQVSLIGCQVPLEGA